MVERVGKAVVEDEWCGVVVFVEGISSGFGFVVGGLACVGTVGGVLGAVFGSILAVGRMW